ncbi:hypothetical protein ACF3N7_05410 [Cruoricaptor ignavus]|uniref:hypothetical protein n=1 Tax=Cruoricaptor ignavus TaxID=1118202 RepID=UPI00370D022A
MEKQITINVTDYISPINQATIDLNGNTGNTYSKTQLDAKIADNLAAMQSSYLGVATTTTTPPATGAYWYRVDAPGTYMGVKVTADDFKDADGNYYDVTLEVKDGVATKRKVAKAVPTSNAKIETWSAKAFPVGSQVVHNSLIYQAVKSATALDMPSEESTVWKIIGGSNIKFDISGGVLSYDTFVENFRMDDTIIYPSSMYEQGYVYDVLTGKRIANPKAANSGYIRILKGDLIKIYAYSSSSSGAINNALITDVNKVRLKSLTTVGTGQRLQFVYTAEQDGFVVANSATGFGNDYSVEITRKEGRYYLEWSKERDDFFLNKKQKEILIPESIIPYALPPTNGTFYDVDNIPLAVGFYQLKIWQSISIPTAALRVSGVLIKELSPKVNSDSERINRGSDGYSNILFEVTEENTTLDLNILVAYPDAVLTKGTKGYVEEKIYLTPNDSIETGGYQNLKGEIKEISSFNLAKTNNEFSSFYYPCLISTDKIANPLGKYYLYFSTDHAGRSGKIGMVYSDDLVNWKYKGVVISSSLMGWVNTECETPSVIWNDEAKKYYCYFQTNPPRTNLEYNQATQIAESVDGISWTWIKEAFVRPMSHLKGDGHNGYFVVQKIGGVYLGFSLMGGTNYASYMAFHTSKDGLNWITNQRHSGYARPYFSSESTFASLGLTDVVTESSAGGVAGSVKSFAMNYMDSNFRKLGSKWLEYISYGNAVVVSSLIANEVNGNLYACLVINKNTIKIYKLK